MDHIVNNSETWPPVFNRPPLPSLAISSTDTTDPTRDFIIQCINREKEKTKARHQNASADDNTNHNNINQNPQTPLKKRARTNHTRSSKVNPLIPIGILKTNSNMRQQQATRDGPAFVLYKDDEERWHLINTQNTKDNAASQEYWRSTLAFPIELSKNNRSALCAQINANWQSRYEQHPHPRLHTEKTFNPKKVRFSPPDHPLHSEFDFVLITTHLSRHTPTGKENESQTPSKRPRTYCPVSKSREPLSTEELLSDIKKNLHLRAERKTTRIANWNINNGFDHLAIASIMAKKDIDILALQEPRISHSTTDDIWVSTMRKELRKCKYELITSQYSYIIFDEQTSGAALASIIRQSSAIQGRLLSVTFKSNDIWEVHTIISIYAVTNAKSGKKYARSHSSRKDINKKLTKALDDEIRFLQETFGDAPITIVGDFQETWYDDQRDNVGLIGKKIMPMGPLQTLVNLGFQSAFHLLHPNQQQITRWNGSKTAGRHIDLQILNETAASLLNQIHIDDMDARNHITSDHLIVIADYNIEKAEQNIVESYRTKTNFRKIAGIKLKCIKTTNKCSITSAEQTCYNISFDNNQFMSMMVQDQLKTLERWQHEANSIEMNEILTSLENSMQALAADIALEDINFNEFFDPSTSTVQRKLVKRNLQRRAQLDSIYNTFQAALYKIAASQKIVTSENKHIEALCTRQTLKLGKVKHYGATIISRNAPSSKIRSALGDLKNAEATLRNLQHSTLSTTEDGMKRKKSVQHCFQSLSHNAIFFNNLKDASLQLSQNHEEQHANETAVSKHRTLDAFSGIWNECKFSSDICKELLRCTNDLLKANNVNQRVGVRQLDQSSTDDDPWADLADWWNGPDLKTLANSPYTDINDPVIANAIRNALIKTRKIRKKAIATLVQNKEKTLTHNSRMNLTRNISQRLNPKLMDEPEAHHVILNPDNVHATSNIRCNNFQDCLDNTLLYHQNWMDRSGSAWEHHWFKTTSKFGHINGISFNFNGKPTDDDFKRLVKQHQDCPDNIRTAYQDAHSDAIAKVMQPPQYPHRAFDWNWHPSSTDTDWNIFIDNYWKAISAIPGKARYNGYTMAVIGRLPRRWIDLHLRVMKMIMILRILPEKTKVQARVPIPKPKPGETRPLSLIHDDMCFILGFLTKHFTLKCEEIQLFPPTIRAYRRGMSTSFITLIDLAMREDAVSFGRYMALTAEDEEKFFDRVSLEVQLAVLFILGFPMEGLLEMKAEEMDNITVEIHTRHGQVIGKFLHGLKQGSPFSVLVSNCTLIFKHRIWGVRDPLCKAADHNGYTMTTWNQSIDGDTPPLVSMEGFCDDNSKWNMGDGHDFASLIQAIQWNLKSAGDLSMIFKIGRRGDKTIIELFNVDIQDIHLLPENGFRSIAWDFKANRPTEEEVDCRVYLKGGLALPQDKPNSISELVWNMLLKGTSLKSERSLGIWRNKFGDTSVSAEKRAFLFGVKIDRLNLSNLKNDKTVKIAVNSLVIPVYQFGILENKCCPHAYDKMDIVLVNKIRKAIGFAWCDAKQLIFVSEENFGMGIRSVSVEMLKSICRELEIQLNDDNLIGKILRGRLEAFKKASIQNAGKASITPYDDINQGIRNLVMEAIRHIAHYGFFIRDMTDLSTTYQMESAILLAQNGKLFTSFTHGTLGRHAFMGTGSKAGTTLGLGDIRLLWSTIYGRCHTLLNEQVVKSNSKMNLSLDQVCAIRSNAVEMLSNDLQALYTVFEWSDCNLASLQPGPRYTVIYQNQCNGSINNVQHWRRISALSYLRHSDIESIGSNALNPDYVDKLLNLTRSELLQSIESQYIQPNRLSLSDVEFLLDTGWPIIVATDGGAEKPKTSCGRPTPLAASAGVVIFHPPDIPFAEYIKAPTEEQKSILDRNLLPWKARACSLPQKIGDHLTDNSHAECFAIILMEEWLPQDIPVLLIMDSEAERERYHNLRNMQNATNRFIFRSVMAGVSKCLGTRLSNTIDKAQKNYAINLYNPYNSSIIALCKHAKNWCFNSSGKQSSWKVSQWEPGQLRTAWAIRSHQLDSSFQISPKNRYGSLLIPNRTFVSANQWVDNVCNAIMRFKRHAIGTQEASEIRKWCPPDVKLGFTGPNFIITFNGTCLDRCVSTAVEHACNNEFIRRSALRPTQGLIIRLQNDLLLKPEMIGRHSYHRRFLEGKTKTHTRAMYTDVEYRKAIIYNCAKNEGWEENKEKLRSATKEATKSYKYLRCPFCTLVSGQHDRHMFQNQTLDGCGLLGNSRHFRFYCLNERVMAVRQQMTQILEDHLTNLFRIAAKWGRKGFATLLDRATNALVKLDRSPFHNVNLMKDDYVKTQQHSYACLKSSDWLVFLESQDEQVASLSKKLFVQWPLVHQLGFITANSYTMLEMKDAEYSPCDLIPMGVIPIVLQDVILTFAIELGARHSQEAKKDFLLQWQQVRAVALLRAISVVMVTGAQIAEHKIKIKVLTDIPSTTNQEIQTPQPPLENHSKIRGKLTNNTSISQKSQYLSTDTATDRFKCEGITCSTLFTKTTNLRPSLMRIKDTMCRRCHNMNSAIERAKAFEHTLAEALCSFRSFYNSIHTLDTITIDSIAAAMSKLDTLPDLIQPTHLKRSTKRNVFPTITMNTIRLIAGTFQWKLASIPTSLDIIFNTNLLDNANPNDNNLCKCTNEQLFFAVNPSTRCARCGGRSPFTSTLTRTTLVYSTPGTQVLDGKQQPINHGTIERPSRNTTRKCKRKLSNDQPCNDFILGDITINTINVMPSARNPLCMEARPPDREINAITQTNNMLSNFVVTYFFRLLAHKFHNIIYQEFLFDVVKAEGGWVQFMQQRRSAGNYARFFDQLADKQLICVIPICYQAHWTLLVRRYLGNSWKILYIDSLSHGSEQRFQDWKNLFLDKDTFSGEWIKVKILEQSELECGARVCLHGACFALSNKRISEIINDLSRFKDLSVRARFLVAKICKDGFWSEQKWLHRLFGNTGNANV